MGRYSTGAWTVNESLRIELSFLLKKGFIKKGCIISFTLSWTDQRGNASGNITCMSSYLDSPEKKYLEVSYTITSGRDNTKTDHCYKVYLYEVNSNLGNGKVLYFLCPQSGAKCRILYKAYDSVIFKSRDSYRNRLYYDCQQTSKLNQYNDSFWRIDKHLEKINKKACHGTRTYNGQLTKAAERYNKLFQKQCKMDELRWTQGMPKSLSRIINKGRLRY